MSDNEARNSHAAMKAEPRAEPPPPEQPEDPVQSQPVTYLPGPEDPPQVQFAGHTFNANLPKTVAMPKSWFERVGANKFFKIGAFDPKTDAVPAQEQTEPKTPDEYKAHAVAWFKTVQSLHDFDARWTEEEELRQRCEVGAEDLDYLSSLARPRRGELKKKLRP